jgi:hypothetical protein
MKLGIAKPPQTPHECDNNEGAWELNYSRQLETLERSRRVRMTPSFMENDALIYGNANALAPGEDHFGDFSALESTEQTHRNCQAGTFVCSPTR